MGRKAEAEVQAPFPTHNETEQSAETFHEFMGVPSTEDIGILRGALAAADRRLERMTQFVAELYARQYLLECTLGLRRNGGFKLDALQFTKGQSMGTLELVRDTTIAALKDGII